MYFNTLFYQFRSLNRNTCAQLLTDTEFISLRPSKSKTEAGDCLNKFIDDIRIPINMCFNQDAELLGVGSEFMKSINNYSINCNATETYSHWQNWVEDDIKRINIRWKIIIRSTGCSTRLWDYGMKHDAELLSRIAPKYGRPPLENLAGYTINISEYLEFDFYDPVWYWDTLSGEKG